MTDFVRADGRARSRRRGARRGSKLLDAAEQVFAELGYHEASIVKITEAAGVAQGTFYLYFASKKDVLRRARPRPQPPRPARDGRAVAEGNDPRSSTSCSASRATSAFAAEHPGLYRIIRQAEFVSPEIFK